MRRLIMSRLIWIYAVWKKILLPIAVKELRTLRNGGKYNDTAEKWHSISYKTECAPSEDSDLRNRTVWSEFCELWVTKDLKNFQDDS